MGPSVRQRTWPFAGPALGLAVLLVAVEIVHGFRVIGNPWLGGDLLYHSALVQAILRGEIPPGGPYQGMPTYYPPGFHLLLAAASAVGGFSFAHADQLLTLLWLPVLPIGMFLLARRLTGRPWVAVLAATITAFAGAYDLAASRLWVNSLFMSGHLAYPLYPRDLVFGLLPFAVLAYIRALEGGAIARVLGWAGLAGLLLGLAAATQVQLLLPLPAALAVGAVLAAREAPGRRAVAGAVFVVVGVISLAIVAPWLLDQLAAIRRNAGVALDSSETLQPAVFGFWSYPREFGLILPLAVLGSGVALLFLRRADGPHPAGLTDVWAPRPVWGLAVLLAWAATAFAAGVLYRPDLPFEDAIRPQRMWLLASQPMAILAAVGLVTVVEHVALGSWRRPALVLPLVGAIVLAACLPATVLTVRLLASTWTRATYAELDLASDHVPDFATLIPRDPGRHVILTYEDWSALAWFETGDWIVGMEPAGYAKLAYDPAIFTGRSQAQRRADLARAFDGSATGLAEIADRYGAKTLVLARRAGASGILDVPATLAAAEPGGIVGASRPAEGNGWDAVLLDPGSKLRVSLPGAARIHIEIRVSLTLGDPGTDVQRRITASAVAADGDPTPIVLSPEPGARADWAVLAGDLPPGATALELTARVASAVQSVRGYVGADGPPAGWRIVVETPDATLLERSP